MVVDYVGHWFRPMLFGRNFQHEGLAKPRICLANRLESHCNCVSYVANRLVEWCFLANRLNVDLACWNWDVSNGVALLIIRPRIANNAQSSRVPHYVARAGAATCLGSHHTLRGYHLSTAALVDLGRGRIHLDWTIVSLCLPCASINGRERIIKYASDACNN